MTALADTFLARSHPHETTSTPRLLVLGRGDAATEAAVAAAEATGTPVVVALYDPIWQDVEPSLAERAEAVEAAHPDVSVAVLPWHPQREWSTADSRWLTTWTAAEFGPVVVYTDHGAPVASATSA